MFKKINSDYMRNMIFGAEDSLVSTVGMLFGLAASSQYTSHLLILAGIVLISVEALSMGVGAYLTETEVHEMDHKHTHRDSTLIDGILMFVSYIIFGCIVIAPYLLLEVASAKYISVLVTLVFLFIVGYIPSNRVKDGFRMLLTAGMAILIGFVVAKIFAV